MLVAVSLQTVDCPAVACKPAEVSTAQSAHLPVTASWHARVLLTYGGSPAALLHAVAAQQGAGGNCQLTIPSCWLLAGTIKATPSMSEVAWGARLMQPLEITAWSSEAPWAPSPLASNQTRQPHREPL
jgi:hypothetical protein